MVRLTEVPISTNCIIKEIIGECIEMRRLFDLGFSPGSRVEPLYQCHGGGTTAYCVKGTLIAIRNEDALKIMAEPLAGGEISYE